ncbi:MAG TPA: MBOAT family protein [Planctomycetales bacterium]|jgi:alginate O-acetyltransferase complex protein AlgI|nr:MBOAT family protein [Planctomycetales bacterium]
MNFTEPSFLYFAPAVFLLWQLCRRRESWQVALLLTASLLFYGFHQPKLLPILLLYCVVDWLVGLGLTRSRRPRVVLTLGVGFNLGLLAFYKYTPLVLATAAWLLNQAGLRSPFAPPAAGDWPIPFGISFYAFTGVAYMVDVFRRNATAETSLSRYALSAVFFPHLVAGPILRADEFLAHLRPGRTPRAPLAPAEAGWLLARGFFKKMVLADRISAAVDPFFAHVGDPTTAGVWALPYVWLYALQIYFDFSAYTDIARGLGLLFGYRWPDNFNWPYLAESVAEFWRRWHITLSRFLRDYLYIPLGGSRRGWWRTNLNLMLTMLLGGLWHGASWSFLLWGGLHGVFLIVHRFWLLCPWRDRLARLTGPAGFLWRGACIALTFHAVCLAWCFFRLPALPDSLACVAKWFVFNSDKVWVGGAADASLWAALAGYGLLAALAGRAQRWLETRPRPFPAPFLRGFVWTFSLMLLLLAVLLSPGGTAPAFIYFQF